MPPPPPFHQAQLGSALGGANMAAALGGGLAFGGAVEEDPREKRRRQQQAMQRELAAQIEEKTRKRDEEKQRRLAEEARDEARIQQEREGIVSSALPGAPPRPGRRPGPSCGAIGSLQSEQADPPWQQPLRRAHKSPLGMQEGIAGALVGFLGGGGDPAADDEARKRQKAEEWQRELAVQAEEARQRKADEKKRLLEEERREEEKVQRELEAQRQKELQQEQEKREAQARESVQRQEAMAKHRSPTREERERRRERRERRDPGENGNESLRETRAEMRKTRERLRETRSKSSTRRPRSTTPALQGHFDDGLDAPIGPQLLLGQSPPFMSGITSKPMEMENGAYQTAINTAANTAASQWFRSASPGPSAEWQGNFSLGVRGIVEQQMQMASEMQKQVEELRRQRDEAREQVLKVREEAINDRATALKDLEQNILEQLAERSASRGTRHSQHLLADHTRAAISPSPPGLHEGRASPVHRAIGSRARGVIPPAVATGYTSVGDGYSSVVGTSLGFGASVPFGVAGTGPLGGIGASKCLPSAFRVGTAAVQEDDHLSMLPPAFRLSTTGNSKGSWERSMVCDSTFVPVGSTQVGLAKAALQDRSKGMMSSQVVASPYPTLDKSLVGTSRLAPPGYTTTPAVASASCRSLIASSKLLQEREEPGLEQPGEHLLPNATDPNAPAIAAPEEALPESLLASSVSLENGDGAEESKERSLLETLPEENVLTDQNLASDTRRPSINSQVTQHSKRSLMAGTLDGMVRAPPVPPCLTPPPGHMAVSDAGDMSSESKVDLATHDVASTSIVVTDTTGTQAVPAQKDTVVSRLGESRAEEFKQAVLNAEGLDPSLRDDLFALLTTPVAGALGRPPRGPSSPPLAPPPSAVPATRPKGEERRAQSANGIDPLMALAEESMSPSRSAARSSERRRPRSGSSTQDEPKRIPRPYSEEVERRPPRSAPAMETQKRRSSISEERRAKSALGSNERCSPAPTTGKVAAQDHDDVLAHFIEERDPLNGIVASSLRPASVEYSPRSHLGAGASRRAPD